jgi:twinkle protein
LANAERGLALLDGLRKASVIEGATIPWEKYLNPEEKARVIPAEALAERVKERIVLGKTAVKGLTLPWEKTHNNVVMKPGDLIVWAGWSRHGKTRMLKQVMLHAIANGERPFIASMEENVMRVWEDLAKMACRTMEPSPHSIDRFVKFVTGNLWLYDQQGTVDPKKMVAVIRYAASELKVTQVMVDSLMMLNVGRDDYEGQGRFINELKAAARDTNITIHLVAHMRKRDGKGGDEAPGTIHDIFGGHEIGSIADGVFIVWRDMKPAAHPACILRIDKQRGDVDWLGTIGLNYHDGARQFVEDVHAMSFWDESQDF